MLKDLTLRYKMILGGLAAVFFPFVIAGTIIYIQLSNSLLEMTREKAVHSARDTSALIEATLMQEIKLASAIAANLDIVKASQTGDYRIAQLELEAIHKRIGRHLFTFFLLDKDGVARADALFPQQIGLDLSKREYFQAAQKGETRISGPLASRGRVPPGTPIIIVSVPINGRNKFLGVVGLAFNTDFLLYLISQKKLGRTGHAFIVDPEGLVVLHPKKEYTFNLRLFDKPGTEELAGLIKRHHDGTAAYTLEGSEMIAGTAGMKLTPWTTVFTQDRAEIMAPVNKLILTIFVSGILFLLITILIIILFFNRLSNPIQKMVEMVKQVTRHSTEIILQIGLDRKIFFASPSFERVTGLKPESILGEEPVLDNLNNIPVEVIWDSLEGGTPWSGRITIQGGRPAPVTLEVMLLPFIDDRGAIQGYIEIGRDITPELMLEKRLQQAQKLEAVGTLAGGIAHDFNNILSGIFGYAELTLMKKGSIEDTENYIHQILNASERARDLVNQILTFSRQTEVDLRPLSLKPVLKEALKLLRASIPATIDILPRINSDGVIMAEPTMLHQIVMNLFTNAAQAIGSKPGTIELELEDFMVDEEFTRTHPETKPGPHIILRVSDTGPGMEPEVLEHIFEPFYTTKAQGEGTGLGLSVVHGIVRKLGGIMTAYSEVGQGAAFNIIVPCIEPEGQILEQDGKPLEKGTARIAVVDDEQVITTAMWHILTNLGFEVTAFTDSPKALAAIQANPSDFDLVITDYAMPHLTGLDLVKTLRENGIDIPIILSSGYFGQAIENEVRNAGVLELLTKPVTAYQLTDAIHRAMQSK